MLATALWASACIEDRYLARLAAPEVGPWAPAHSVQPRREEQSSQHGAAVALTSGQLLIGAPRSHDCGDAADAPLSCTTGLVSAWTLPLRGADVPALLLPSSDDLFEFGRALAADLDGRVLVGAPSYTLSGSHVGAAFAFRRQTGRWSPAERLEPDVPARAPDAAVGDRVALEGVWAAVFAPRAACPEQPELRGAVDLYRDTGTQFEPVATLCTPQRALPWSEALAGHLGDVALDGDTLVVGLPWGRSDTDVAGRTLVFALAADATPVQIAELRHPDFSTDGTTRFGMRVSADEGWVAVAAPDEGAVYTFAKANGRMRLEQALRSDLSDADFGRSLALFEGQLAIGAPDDDSCPPAAPGPTTCADFERSGAVHVYTLEADGVWRRAQRIEPPRLGARDFGQSVAIRGDRLVGGAPWERVLGVGVDGPSDLFSGPVGAAFMFERRTNETP